MGLPFLGRIGSDLVHGAAWSVLPTAFGGASDLAFLGLMVVVLSVYDWSLWSESTLLRRPRVALVDVSLQFWILIVYGVFANQQFIYFQF